MDFHHICELLLVLLLAAGCAVYFRQKRALETDNLRLQRERKLVVDFMHELAVALEENPSKQSLMQRIVSAAIDSTGAMSACLYERKEGDILRPAAIEGLFPPQTRIADEVADKLRTRSRFIEQVLRSETIRIGQGLVRSGREQSGGKGQGREQDLSGHWYLHLLFMYYTVKYRIGDGKGFLTHGTKNVRRSGPRPPARLRHR